MTEATEAGHAPQHRRVVLDVDDLTTIILLSWTAGHRHEPLANDEQIGTREDARAFAGMIVRVGGRR